MKQLNIIIKIILNYSKNFYETSKFFYKCENFILLRIFN